ncbi:hypothetical protein [Risungbinella massiliensis]|uniref:hypothetical protein n=1 Tax=Risungbinella massiliensis TaxID=1329796 RepID=UPI0005CB8C7A|nr:hypothetical protein [Risungbinella massiliensis]
MMTWVVVISVIAILLGTVTTLMLAKTQSAGQNNGYVRKSPRTLLWITIIYIVAIVISVVWMIKTI